MRISGEGSGNKASDFGPGLFGVVVGNANEENAGGMGRRFFLFVVADADEHMVFPRQAGDSFGLVLAR